MLESPSSTELPERGRWPVCLASAPREALLDVAESLARRYRARHASLPGAGLALLQVRDAVLGEPFNLGEIPLSKAVVELDGPDGSVVLGGAEVMADDQPLATALAVCDAVLAARLDGLEEVARLVQEGAAVLEQRQVTRQAMREATRVDFALLNQEGGSPS